MKKCSYCGRDNIDEAVNCRECGTEFEHPDEAEELHDSEKTKTIRIFGTHEAAALAVAKLEAHGIKCLVNADDCAGMYPNLTTAAGVRLKVLETDVEAATALLDAQATPAEIELIVKEAILSSPEKTVPVNKFAWGQIIIGIIIGIILCLIYQWGDRQGVKIFNYYTADGKNDEVVYYRDGHAEKLAKDRNLDGKVDEWIYYEKGKVVRVEYDENFDGKRDLFVTYSNSSPVSSEQDTDYNGTPDLFCIYKNGIVQQADYRPNGSKCVTTREKFENGVLTEIWRGGDSNGNFSEVVKYDSFFNPVSTNNPSPITLFTAPR